MMLVNRLKASNPRRKSFQVAVPSGNDETAQLAECNRPNHRQFCLLGAQQHIGLHGRNRHNRCYDWFLTEGEPTVAISAFRLPHTKASPDSECSGDFPRGPQCDAAYRYFPAATTHHEWLPHDDRHLKTVHIRGRPRGRNAMPRETKVRLRTYLPCFDHWFFKWVRLTQAALCVTRRWIFSVGDKSC
jgi:hypothetical protein